MYRTLVYPTRSCEWLERYMPDEVLHVADV